MVGAEVQRMLDGGELRERGTHAELLARGGRYAGYWADRNVAARWRLG